MKFIYRNESWQVFEGLANENGKAVLGRHYALSGTIYEGIWDYENNGYGRKIEYDGTHYTGYIKMRF